MCHRKLDNQAISAVIGVILMVAVAVAMSAVAYAYFTGMIGGSMENAPIISLTQDSHDHNASLTVGDVSNNNVYWNNVWFTFVDKTNQTEWKNLPGMNWGVNIGIPRSGTVSSGQLITIKTSLTGPLGVNAALRPSHEYQIALVDNETGGTMGVVSWTQ